MGVGVCVLLPEPEPPPEPEPLPEPVPEPLPEPVVTVPLPALPPSVGDFAFTVVPQPVSTINDDTHMAIVVSLKLAFIFAPRLSNLWGANCKAYAIFRGQPAGEGSHEESRL